ncbi:putative DD41D transposase [Trichonephila clavipes]|nr:putative DD41D transposase [Trichonephila clavipes]
MLLLLNWNPLRVLSTSCQVIYSQFGLAIHQNDHQARRRFVEWAQNEIAVAPDFHKRILFSNEAHFWLNGYVNKQNCHIWNEANPQVYVETPLHPEKLTVWCALWAGGIIGPYFFKNDQGHNVKVNGDRYRAMITNFFIPELNNHDVQELWFQQDGATCHTARATIDLLKDTFGDRLISRFGPVNWPPRSCDLTPLDYFLWGYVKSLVYADKPQTLDHLEDNIRRVIADMRPQMLEKVIENWTSRLDYTRASRGKNNPRLRSLFHLKILKCRELIFKDSSVITCPVKDMSPPRIIIAKTKLNCLEFRETLRKMELKIIKIEETTPLALQECLQYTWTAKMAPSWNILQNFLVQGSDFLTTAGPLSTVIPIGLRYDPDILVLKPSPCLNNGSEEDDCMGLDE